MLYSALPYSASPALPCARKMAGAAGNRQPPPRRVKKAFLTGFAANHAALPLRLLPVPAKIPRIFERGNWREAIFALENWILGRANRPVRAAQVRF